MINRILKFLFTLPIIIVLVVLITINIRLMIDYPNTPSEQLQLLRGLKHSLDSHADTDMQELYPEGHVFFNALYGLSWSKHIQHVDTNSHIYAEGIQEVQRAFNNVNSDDGRQLFDKDLSLPYGAFYTGWSMYLLGNKLLVTSPEKRKPAEIAYFKERCENIAAAVAARIYPVSYSGMAWPGDVIVCIAALKLHDKIFIPRYQSTIQSWVVNVKQKLDPIGLIPHSVKPATGEYLEGARGSSQSLLLIFLHEIDSAFGRQQFNIYKQKFLDSRVGLIGVREYPAGEFGIGDIDSGPVILQIGFAASVVGRGTMDVYGEHHVANTIQKQVNAFGLPFENDGRKKYLFTLLPIADAFIAWTNPLNQQSSGDQFMVFHLYSTIIIILLLVALWYFLRPSNKDNRMHIPW